MISRLSVLARRLPSRRFHEWHDNRRPPPPERIGAPGASVRTPTRARNRERWALILAGGEGLRLRPLTRAIAGEDRPKQFCAVIGGDTMLEWTRRRTALTVPPARTLVAKSMISRLSVLARRLPSRRFHEWHDNRRPPSPSCPATTTSRTMPLS
jgi:hypothetical protein